MPIRSGSVTLAVRVWELSCSSAPRMWGTSSSTVAPEGELVAAVLGSAVMLGS